MRINNNIMAMNTYRQLGITNSSASKSMEKLSSGLRINRAGDDAAGLSISEKMRAQIRGLTMASKNAQDGISLIQTAEGALQETHAILQRMRELAVQSANDTNVEVDRAAIQAEIDELAAEITRIANTTEFNTQKLLDGSFAGKFHIGANEGQDITLAVNNMSAKALNVAGRAAGLEIANIQIDTGKDIDAYAMENNAEYTVEKLDQKLKIGTDEYEYVLKDESGKIYAISVDGKEYNILANAADKLEDVDLTDAYNVDFGDKVLSGKVKATGTSGGTDFTVTATVTAEFEQGFSLAAGDYKVVDQNHAFVPNGVNNRGLVDSRGNLVALSTDAGATWKDIEGNIILKVANNANLTVGDIFTVSGGGGIDVSSQASASKAITTINKAIEAVSSERSKLGAYQNRLEHTIKNLDTSAENLQASESRIRDVDMAKEMMEFTKNNILQQAATAMLAQANQAPQTVLQLLR